ncbi:AsmA family protein [Dyella sp.]|uniref:AsmA family protein n=1 Tax=Dyella sp. TaxID=1869338 RepID=UPI002ECFE66E
MSRALRLTLIILASTMLVVSLVAIVTVHLLLQPERFTAMLQTQARKAGLELNLSSPASPSLFPRPALELQGLTLSAQNATVPILIAARGRLALPWRTLLGGNTDISQMEIDSPRVDLDALQDWLANLPTQPDSKSLQIPRIDTGVLITRGSILSGQKLLLNDVTLEAGKLAPGQPFPLDATARLADGNTLQMHLHATPRSVGQALQLDHINLQLSQPDTLTLQLDGDARWHGAADASVRLEGKLEHSHAGSYAMSMNLTPANQTDPLLLAIQLDGPDSHAHLKLPPVALAQWWSRLDDPTQIALTMPPGSGQVDIGNIDVGGVSIDGLHLETGLPAGTSSTLSPARR